MYKQSPYCLVRLGGGGQHTKVDVKGGQHPIWDEDFHFPIYKEMQGINDKMLRVTCYVSGGKLDVLLGSGEVSVEDCLRQGEFDGELRLTIPELLLIESPERLDSSIQRRHAAW